MSSILIQRSRGHSHTNWSRSAEVDDNDTTTTNPRQGGEHELQRQSSKVDINIKCKGCQVLWWCMLWCLMLVVRLAMGIDHSSVSSSSTVQIQHQHQHSEEVKTKTKTGMGSHSSQHNNHIVVAHCKEDLSWLDQFQLFEPRVCEFSHFHIYSKCSVLVDLKTTIPAVAECSTLHILKNFGTEEYAYLSHIEENYDSLPPLISFIQGGGITENPHIIFDIMVNMPNIQYKSLSRVVGQAWHFAKYDEFPGGEKEILAKHLGFLQNAGWLSDYRGMFTVSRNKIREHSLNVYADINAKIRNRVCDLRNCCMETWFSSLFGCNPHLFDLSREGNQNCKSGLYEHVANAVQEEDYRKDAFNPTYRSPIKDKSPTRDTTWMDCGDDRILYGKSTLNGALICVRHTNQTNTNDGIKYQLFTEMIFKDTRRADFTNVKWKKPSQWHNHTEIIDAQL